MNYNISYITHVQNFNKSLLVTFHTLEFSVLFFNDQQKSDLIIILGGKTLVHIATQNIITATQM
jgi:hypothetical protein